MFTYSYLASDMSTEEIKKQIYLQKLKYQKAKTRAMNQEANMKEYIALYYKNKVDSSNVEKLQALHEKSDWKKLYEDLCASIKTGLAD